jgi:hypothetical protein
LALLSFYKCYHLTSPGLQVHERRRAGRFELFWTRLGVKSCGQQHGRHHKKIRIVPQVSWYLSLNIMMLIFAGVYIVHPSLPWVQHPYLLSSPTMNIPCPGGWLKEYATLSSNALENLDHARFPREVHLNSSST